jgi:uncharacterized membrane protein YdbT with pleckstrin-like domain
MPEIYKADSVDVQNNHDSPVVSPVVEGFKTSIHFDIQDSEEHVILLLRKHWITNITWIFLAIIFMIAPLALASFPMLSFLPANYQFMAVIVWYLFTTAFIFEQFLSWYFNIYLVTDQRVIDYDFSNLLYKGSADADIEKIQDVSYKTGGIAQVIFNFGDLLIETAGAIPNLDFEKVPNPAYVAKVLHNLRDQINEGNNP